MIRIPFDPRPSYGFWYGQRYCRVLVPTGWRVISAERIVPGDYALRFADRAWGSLHEYVGAHGWQFLCCIRRLSPCDPWTSSPPSPPPPPVLF